LTALHLTTNQPVRRSLAERWTSYAKRRLARGSNRHPQCAQRRHRLANLIGGENVENSQGYLVDIAGLTSALADLVDECKPKATAAMADFASAIERQAATYQPGASPSAVEADKGALGELRAKGIWLYSRVGVSTASWKVIPVTER
jgi:hypothetical protein